MTDAEQNTLQSSAKGQVCPDSLSMGTGLHPKQKHDQVFPCQAACIAYCKAKVKDK